jgi:isocitrate/isopropylmalate dehydrogenase
MSRRRRYLVACLAGHGIGPEVMAEASRALAEVSRLHGFVVDEAHLPFGREAVTRSGNELPAATRAAYLGADAILFASSSQPALDSVKEGLDLVASVTQMRMPGGDVTVFAPLVDDAEDWTIERAFAAARGRNGRLASVSVSRSWRTRVALAAAENDVVEVRHLSLAEALPLLLSGNLDVLVTEQALAEALAQLPQLAPSFRPLMATGLLAATGPSLFGPKHGSALDIAGQGVANPSEMLLAAALMLGEGFGRRWAAETLERSVGSALSSGYRTPDMAQAGVASTTREFVDVVLSLLPSSRNDTEFAIGGVL